MKKQLIFLLLLISAFAHGQTPVPVIRNNGAVTAVDVHLHTKSLKIPVYADTAHATAALGLDSIGSIFKEFLTSNVWVRDSVLTGGKKWTLLMGGGGGGGGFTLSDTGYTRLLTSPSLLQKTIDSMKIVNDGRYFQKSDTGYTKTLATPELVKKKTDSLSGIYDGKYILKTDTGYGHTVSTPQLVAKKTDSVQALLSALIALKLGRADTVGNLNAATNGHVNKVADSLAALFLKKSDSVKGTDFASRNWLYKVVDSLSALVDTTKIRYYGTGDTTLRAGGKFLLSALIRDSLGLHIRINPDSSLTFYAITGSADSTLFYTVYRSDTSRRNIYAAIAAVSLSAGAYYPPLDSVLWKGPISARNMQVGGIKSTGQDTLTATTYSESYDRVVVQDTATGAGNGKLYRRKMQTIDMTGAADGKVPTYQSSSSSFVLTTPSGSGNIMNVRRDTITNGSTIIPINPDPDNTGWINLRTQRNTQSYIARLFDTTVNSTTQFRLMTGMNSMGEHPDLVHQNFVKVMSPRGRSAGPGYISPGNNHTFATVSGGTTSWTERNILSGTPGKGIDGYDAITTGTGTDSIIISFGTQNKGFDHTWADTVAVFWYGQTGGGTFKVDIDGIGGGSYVTINTSSAIGPQQTKIATTTGLSHTVAIIPVSEGTTHSIWCGVNEYRKVGGWIFEHVAKGASVVTDWTTLNAADWEKWVGFIKPTAFWMDWVVTSAGVMDSLAYANGLRTMAGRVHAVDSTVDIVAYGSTPLSITTTGATAFNNLPSYNRATKRLCIDSGWAYWDPACIYGKTIFSSVFRGTQSSDSIHRTSSGSYAEVCMQLAGLGMLPMYLPPTQATIYNSDNAVLSPRTLNFNKQFLHLDSLTFLRFGGSTGNPVFSMDFTNSLALAWSTGGVKVTTDFSLVSSQPITSNYAGTTIGNFNASLPNTNGAAAFITSGGGTSCTSCYLMYGQATAVSWILNLENLNAGAGYAIMQAKTGGTGNPVSQYVTGGTTWDAGADHSASNAYKIGTGGATFTNPAITIPTSLKVGIGSITSPTAALHLPAGTASANTAPLKLTSGTNLTTPENGAIEYDGTHYYGTAGGSRLQLDNTGGGGSPPFADNTAIAMNNSDNTKLAKLDLSGITTATTRTYGLPDFNGTFAMTNHAQTWSGAQDMTGAAVTATTQSAGDNSTKVATTAYVDRAASGATYTSSTSSISNATSLSINQASYTVSGTIVHVVIDGSYTATSGGNYVTFSVSLPSGKNSGSSANRMAGFGFNREEPSGAARTLGQVAVNNSASTAAITLVAGPTNGATNSFVISFDYSL